MHEMIQENHILNFNRQKNELFERDGSESIHYLTVVFDSPPCNLSGLCCNPDHSEPIQRPPAAISFDIIQAILSASLTTRVE
jgi:hypothetical protein